MQHNKKKGFKIFTVGWEPDFINDLLSSIEKNTGIEFTHGLVGDASRISFTQQQYPQLKFVPLSKTKEELLPEPDYELLASLECHGVPTIRSMIQGDRVLRHRPAEESFAYATLLIRQMIDMFKTLQPDAILGSYDSLHAGLGLAVAKSLDIPWVAMAFTAIPDNLTGFSKGLMPDSLVRIRRPVDEELRGQARAVLQNVRSRKQKVMAFRPPSSMMQWLRQYFIYGRNLLKRRQEACILGIDRFTYPTIRERAFDIFRRSFNRILLPTSNMLNSPLESRFIYFPLHMAPESSVDTWAPFYQNQLAFVAQLSLAIPADVSFVVKLHFSDPDNYSRKQLQELMQLPRIHIAHPDAPGDVFIEKSALVVGIQGTSCLEAALLGKPVLIFGDSPYQHFPRTERASQPDQLYEQIQRMLTLSLPTDDEIIEAYASYMARYMPGRINDWGVPIEPDQLDKYANSFLALRAYVEEPGNRANWYNQPPFVKQ